MTFYDIIWNRLIYWILWNLFLAALPVALAHLIRRTWALKTGWRFFVLPVGFLWLIFLPNTCYLLTEWRHFILPGAHFYSRWYNSNDTDALVQLILRSLFFFTYSGFGMLAFVLAVRPVADLLRKVRLPIWLWGLPFFPLISLGVYLGLILRFNSWDLLNRPGIIWERSLLALARPDLFTFIIAFGAFLWLAYYLLDIWVDGAMLRWQRGRPALNIETETSNVTR